MNVPPHQARPFTFYYFNHSWDSRIIHPIHRLNSRRFIPDHASPCRTLPPCPSSPLQLEVVVLFYTVPYMNGGRVLDILQSTGWSENFKNLDFIAQDLIPFLCWQKNARIFLRNASPHLCFEFFPSHSSSQWMCLDHPYKLNNHIEVEPEGGENSMFIFDVLWSLSPFVLNTKYLYFCITAINLS